MAKVRILGPRDRLGEVLRVLQELGVLHLTPPSPIASLRSVELSPKQQRDRRHLQRALEDAGAALAALAPVLGPPLRPSPAPAPAADVAQLARWARLAFRARRSTERLALKESAVEEERALILKYQQFFSAFRPLLETEGRWPNATLYHVLLRKGEQDAIARLRSSFASVIGAGFEIFSRELSGGDIALLVIVSAQVADRVERLLAEARVQEIPVPEAYGGGSLSQAIPRMLARLGELPGEQDEVRRERRELARARGPELRRAAAGIAATLQAMEALPLSGVTVRAFVIEGWLPADGRAALAAQLNAAVGESVVVDEVSREEWESEQAPVVLKNPRLFRPFEAMISLLPLPRYGTIDPTPFVAVFFPVLFGMILGDVGYGVLLALVGLLLHWRSRPGTPLRSVAEIIGPCALFAILAGFLYGELFGDLGRRWLGLRPVGFDREEALIPFLLLAVAIGTVHVLLGLILGVVSAARQHRRKAVGRGASAAAVILIILALLAAVGVLPDGFFTPAVVGLLVAFPVLIFAEGVVGPIELLSTLGNILSYARIMALGVASVMLAVVANRMVGAFGSAVVGVLFALLFHLVNFAIGLFSPAIHALRLHYVEFFGKFYSPGGVRYEPFGSWARDGEVTRT